MKKLNLKLTTMLVSLFISLILLVLGGVLKNNFCLCFGLVFLSVALIIFLVGELQKFNAIQNQLKQDIADAENEEEILELQYTQKAIKKQKKMIIFGGFAFAIILIVLGVACVL